MEASYLWIVSAVIFYAPNIPFLVFYWECMSHRRCKFLEITLIIIFGPFVRWACTLSSILLSMCQKEVEDLNKVVYITRLVDGVMETYLQVLWSLYLTATGFLIFPIGIGSTRGATDSFGNSMKFPVVIANTMVVSVFVLAWNLIHLWNCLLYTSPSPRDS